MANNSSNKMIVPQARQAMDNMKYEIAGEFGLNYQNEDLGNLTSRQNGSVGGEMVRRMIQSYEQGMTNAPGGMQRH